MYSIKIIILILCTLQLLGCNSRTDTLEPQNTISGILSPEVISSKITLEKSYSDVDFSIFKFSKVSESDFLSYCKLLPELISKTSEENLETFLFYDGTRFVEATYKSSKEILILIVKDDQKNKTEGYQDILR